MEYGTTNSKQRVSQSLYCLNMGSWKREKIKEKANSFARKNRNSGMRLGKEGKKEFEVIMKEMSKNERESKFWNNRGKR